MGLLFGQKTSPTQTKVDYFVILRNIYKPRLTNYFYIGKKCWNTFFSFVYRFFFVTKKNR